MAQIGAFALWLTFFLCVYAVAAFAYGARGDDRLVRSGRNALFAGALTTTFASLLLFNRLVVSDFSFAYVASHTSSDLPLIYKISAFWAGQQGSLLLWLWLLMLAATAVSFTKPPRAEDLIPYAGAVLAGIGVFFSWLVAFVSSPFNTLSPVPAEGSGLNLLLQNSGMIIHPVTLFLGYVGLAIPFAFGIASLLRGRSDETWIRAARPWTMGAWVFLSVGILYGAKWAYVELGWGGYWAWDPVENASLIPWLILTAFIHSGSVQEKRGMFKGWSMVLAAFGFWLTLFGTYLTRSGILDSVHAFGDHTLGNYVLGFMILTAAASAWAIWSRRALLAPQDRVTHLASREASFLGGIVLLTAAALAIMLGTLYPVWSELLGSRMSVGAPFFNRVFVPLALLIVVLESLAPLLSWRRTSWKAFRRRAVWPIGGTIAFILVAWLFGLRHPLALTAVGVAVFAVATVLYELAHGARSRSHRVDESFPDALMNVVAHHRRRYGGYIVHLATAVIVIGMTGSSLFTQEVEVTLNKGESAQVGAYTVTFPGLQENRVSDRRAIVFTDLLVHKGEREVGTVRPQTIFSVFSREPAAEVAILGGLWRDFYVVLSGWHGPDTAMFKLIINPMVSWIWIGMYLLVAGALIAVWPDRARTTIPRTALQGTRPVSLRRYKKNQYRTAGRTPPAGDGR